MSGQKFLNTMRMFANMATQGLAYTAVGIVSAFDPNTYQVQVNLQQQTSDSPALQTGWIPLASPWTGAGWGLFAPSSPGDLILVFFQDGSLQNPVAGMRLYFDNALPLTVQGGEFWLVHQTGSMLQFNNDGTVVLNANANMTISSDTEIDITAPIVNINASSQTNLNSPTILAGPTGGAFESVVKSDSTDTVNFMAT